MSVRSVIAVLFLSATLHPLAAAGEDGGGVQLVQNDTQSYDFQPLNSGEGATRGITRGERETVQNYISGGRGSIAAWQSGLERLPPGVEDSLQPGRELPPGVALHGLPNALEGALPPRREEAWAVSGYNLLLVDRESGVIVDVWPKVFEPY
ncbi:MAG: hypothetical protein WD489_06575 [Rhodovibrionaceae bacterium]